MKIQEGGRHYSNHDKERSFYHADSISNHHLSIMEDKEKKYLRTQTNYPLTGCKPEKFMYKP